MMTQHIIDADKLEKLEVKGSVSSYNQKGEKVTDLWISKAEVLELLANSPQADGMVLVPRTPSDEMLDAGRDIVRIKYVDSEITAMEVYKAMLSAYKPQADSMVQKPKKEGIYVWRNASAVSLVYVSKRPSGVEVGGTLNAQVIDSSKFYDGCAIDKWLGGHWIEVTETPMLSAYKSQAEHIGDVNEMIEKHVLEQAAQAIDALASSGENKDDWTITRDLAFHRASEAVRALKVKPQADDVRKDACDWVGEDDEYMPNTYKGDCGIVWTFTEDGVKENGCIYCPKCGGRIVEKVIA